MERILIVEDNKDMQDVLSNILKSEGFEIFVAGDGCGALKLARGKNPQVVLLDVKLPDTNGVELIEKIRKIDDGVSIIMLTAFGDVKDAVKALKLGAYDYLTKPFDNEELILVIKRAIQTRCLSREVENLKRKLGEMDVVGEIMGESPQIKKVLSQVKVIAPTDMTVVLQGESGTGKELIARMIHQISTRKTEPFVAIDCGAIPETLVESELFGYEKGAFTGADAQKEGKFEQARGGTLFLDEITNLPDRMQIKLMRVLQERVVQHLGGKKTIPVHARMVIATNIILEEALRRGTFRQDLFHRLNEFCIELPPLRVRREDIPVLAKHFMDEASKEFTKNVKGFSADAMNYLLEYPWPGNVRELKNVVRKAVLLSDSNLIKPVHLPREVLRKNDSGPGASEMLKDDIDLAALSVQKLSFKDITERLERDLVKRAIEQAGGNKVKAAKMLQMNRKALYRKMKKLGMAINGEGTG